MGPRLLRMASCVIAALVPALSAAQDRTPAPELRETATALFGTLRAPTPAEAEAPMARLGQALFWDIRLSADGHTACGSCHVPGAWGADRRAFSRDARGRSTSRHSPTVLNSMAAPAGLRWLADRPSGAAQAENSITGSMGFARAEDILPVLRRHGYEPAFRAAFPNEANPLTPANYGRALQAYQATLRTPSAFDRWLAGEDSAMTERQQRGLQRFLETGCAACHNGPLLGGAMMQRFGVAEDYAPHTGSARPDIGLAAVTKNDEDRWIFRVAPLRNVARTAPYFHDGAVADLRQATRIMARVQLGRELEEAVVDDLLAFMEALTGDLPANYAPPAGIPFEVPAGAAP